MKLLVVFAAFLALSAGDVNFLVPGDNTGYVEGESRFIWIPDGDGVPHLVDLEATEDSPAERNGANNQYWLFTRSNPTNHQIIVHGDANTIWNSNYVASRELKVLVHGWNSNGNSAMNPVIRDAYLAICDCNVIVVDWRSLANSLYSTASRGVPGVGEHTGRFVEWLINTAGGNWSHVHFIGFSLGAHAVGNAGRTVGGRASRVTGLDPAGPNFGNSANALRNSDGQYVETIHTDGGLLGIFDPIGDANFYPNGGRNAQPGCWISTCSHSRAYDLFAASVRYNHFVAQECANLTEARNNRCTGRQFNMGNGIVSKRGHGIFGLSTGRNWPLLQFSHSAFQKV